MSKKNWSVGDRVQKRNKDAFIVGAITVLNTETITKSPGWGSLSSRSKEETVIKSAVVKWDDGTEETLQSWGLHPEDSALERQFRSAVPDVHALISEKLALSAQYLAEAQKISDDSGIPFYSHISPLSQSYVPNSLQEKWNEVSREVVQEETEAGSEDDYCGGWQHSAVCY